jgi:ABC-type transporter Mla maintaining outer membrane lipid asymmetry ATPase subunit MlaF
MENILIQARGVKPYIEGEESLPAINLNILSSNTISIIGPVSGSKRIWLKALAGVLELEAGELILLGHSMSNMQRSEWLKMRKDIAYVGQDTPLLSVLSVIDNILLPASYHQLASRSELVESARSMLLEIGFDDEQGFSRLPAYISVTEQYYAMLVRAFILKPKVIFIDDMFSLLGATASENINNFLQKRIDQDGLALVQNTRDMRHAIKSSAEILFVSSSNMLMFNNKDDLFGSAESEVAEYLKKYNIN